LCGHVKKEEKKKVKSRSNATYYSCVSPFCSFKIDVAFKITIKFMTDASIRSLHPVGKPCIQHSPRYQKEKEKKKCIQSMKV
jgi:hypothetical protein